MGRSISTATLAGAVALDAVRDAAAAGAEGLVPLLRPIDTGLEAFPDVTLTVEETLAVARGQFVSPAAGLPGPSEHYRLRGPDGALVAIASSSGGRLAPDKVFVSPTPVVAAKA